MPGELSNVQLQVEPVLKEDAGVPVHRFDPDASPEEKAAKAGKGRDQLASIKPKEPQERGEWSLSLCVGLACSTAPEYAYWFARYTSHQC